MTFGGDRQFLLLHDPSLITLQSGTAAILVSAKYQGKVFTSSTDGDDGPSFGWVHYKAFDAPTDAHMNAYGGENRLWLGPEGGPFSLFFQQGATMEFKNWKTPNAFDTEPWTIDAKTNSSVTLQKSMELKNYAGTPLSLAITRKIRMLDRDAIAHWLQIQLVSTVKAVAYQTENTLTNTGKAEWTAETGMPCIWILDMFPPSDQTTIVIPYADGPGLPATTNYFGEIPLDRIRYKDNVLFFRADGKQRGKLGMHPGRTMPVAGSYDAQRQLLTIILFDRDPLGRYLNQEWRTDKPPFSGDVMNAYNDGPLADGSQMGPFYELESVSPAAFLPPGHAQIHRQSVFHFTGSTKDLDAISRKVFGVSLETITSIF
jgi:hypothetical protein